jgi:hypothetical protein
MDWIQLAEDWWALMGMVMNIQVPQKARISLLPEQLLLASQNGLSVYFGIKLLLNRNIALSLANLNGCHTFPFVI